MPEVIGYRDQVAPKPAGTRPTQDIRKFIAQSQTKQMDPNFFPPVEYQRYPLMILDPHNKPYTDAVGRPIVVRNAEEEDAFHEEHPEAPRVQDPVDMRTELEQLRAENTRLKAAKGDAPDDAQPAAKPAKAGKSGVAALTNDKRPTPGSKLED